MRFIPILIPGKRATYAARISSGLCSRRRGRSAVMTETNPIRATQPTTAGHPVNGELAVIGNTAGAELPVLVVRAGEKAACRFLEFFTVRVEFFHAPAR
jgi:hypothetical protein